ncbi:GIY-YIG nuclease family protein [Ramlibacter sp. WS9]|uniref:GIY-YIG nuclease family protein n=1 Tax=Ramlibacter sp. WS9 TaxID=1882741 RepID=UPI0013052CA1|nr:GIY-YIG nuclease family protein [Ramlibacter sp. WS9]
MNAPGKKWITLYVLELQDGCYYIGQSAAPEGRINDHIGGKGSQWTRKHPPIRLVERRPAGTRDWKDAESIENELTLTFMRQHGWQRVRGGFWCNIDEEATRKGLLAHDRHAELECSVPLELPSRSLEVRVSAPDSPPFARAHKPWTSAESERVRIGYLQGMHADALAALHQRTPVAIASRLVRLGVIEHRRYIRREVAAEQSLDTQMPGPLEN